MVIRVKNERFIPEPLLDWDEIRKAKFRCENKCGRFNTDLGGCSLGRLPDPNCEYFRRIIRERGSSSAAERLFADEEATGSRPVSRSGYHLKGGQG